MIFVFGSNEAGRHGAGAAKFALRHKRAVYGLGFGPAGDSFAIPTMDWHIKHLPVEVIEHYVNRFIVFARMNPTYTFQVTALGCGLAGHRHDVIAPLFKYAPDNCQFDTLWEPYLPKKKFWGTY
jgi:hypothetical protein